MTYTRETELEKCLRCPATPGTDHADWCDHARCPSCGEQLIQCGEHLDDERPARWHGVDPHADVARELGWWTTAAGIDYLVEDYTRVRFAITLGQVTWDPEGQQYVIGQIDESAINSAMEKPGAR